MKTPDLRRKDHKSETSDFYLVLVVYGKNVNTQKKSRKAARWVDLELPPAEGTSSYRLDGYKTVEEDDESGEEGDEDEENEDENNEDEMDIDDE